MIDLRVQPVYAVEVLEIKKDASHKREGIRENTSVTQIGRTYKSGYFIHQIFRYFLTK